MNAPDFPVILLARPAGWPVGQTPRERAIEKAHAPMPSYRLSPNIHFCVCDDALIFLDVARDTYFRFSGRQRDWFESIRAAGANQDLNGPEAGFAERLVAKQILTRDRQTGVPLSAACFTPPVACLSRLACTDTSTRVVPTAGHMMLATLSAWWLEHACRFEHVVASVQQWKANTARRPAPSVEHVLELASRFHALTPYFFSTHDACRFRSLALIRFLTVFGVQADWVFGVRLCPFGAHCWVEYNGVILNEDLDTVTEFRPIMTI